VTKIDVARVQEAKRRRNEKYARDPASAQIVKTVEISLLDTYRKEGRVRGFVVASDEPEWIGGTNAAPQPLEYLLMALGMCQMSMLVSYACTMRVPLDDVLIEVTGHRDNRSLAGDDSVRSGFSRIEMRTRLVSEASRDQLERLARTAEGRCPVLDNLVNPTAVDNEVLHGDDVLLSTSAAAATR
jgi:uncharacterized OsmC-like protein